MKILCCVLSMALLVFANVAGAGILTNNNWQPAHCGTKPITPAINASNVETFNKNVAAINEWQQQAKTYYECLIKEANVDNNVIAESANREQSEYRKTIEAMGAAADAAKKKLDKQ